MSSTANGEKISNMNGKVLMKVHKQNIKSERFLERLKFEMVNFFVVGYTSFLRKGNLLLELNSFEFYKRRS